MSVGWPGSPGWLPIGIPHVIAVRWSLELKFIWRLNWAGHLRACLCGWLLVVAVSGSSVGAQWGCQLEHLCLSFPSSFGFSQQGAWFSRERATASQEPACQRQEAELVLCYFHCALLVKVVKSPSRFKGMGGCQGHIVEEHIRWEILIFGYLSLLENLTRLEIRLSEVPSLSFPGGPSSTRVQESPPFPEVPCPSFLPLYPTKELQVVFHTLTPKASTDTSARFASTTGNMACHFLARTKGDMNLRGVKKTSVEFLFLYVCWGEGECGRKHCCQKFLGKLWSLPEKWVWDNDGIQYVMK